MLGGFFGLIDDLYIPKNSPFGFQSERLNIQYVKLQKKAQVDTEALYMLSLWSLIVLTIHTDPKY